MTIINLTQHIATTDQLAAGVVNLSAAQRGKLISLLTFEKIPTPKEVNQRADDIAVLAANELDELYEPYGQVMIGGAPYLMAALERACFAYGLTPVYSFTQRESAEEKQADGSVKKVAVFRHAGWVEVAKVGG